MAFLRLKYKKVYDFSFTWLTFHWNETDNAAKGRRSRFTLFQYKSFIATHTMTSCSATRARKQAGSVRTWPVIPIRRQKT